jgi:TonB-dependent SusC/RagA subfamily outer membrane receptor
MRAVNPRPVKLEGHMSGVRVSLRCISVLSCVATLACASGNTRPTRPMTLEASDTASVTNTDGKSMEDLFAGKFPGVIVQRAGNGGIQVLIRGGANSFYGSDEPLYVIDDTPLAAGSRGIVYLNPNDIERIEVLKNPSDVALYGMRGGNGVVKITTKRPGRR